MQPGVPQPFASTLYNKILALRVYTLKCTKTIVLLATAINSTYSYGRLALADISITDGALQTKMANAIMVLSTDEGYLLIDGYGRYLAMDDDESHKTFQLYNGVQPGCLWSAEAEGNGTWRFTNNVRTGYSIAQEGTYTNVAPTTLTTGVVYPRLYQLVK